MIALANPARFAALARRLSPWLIGATAVLFAAGLWFALVASPADYQQGETVRIMYVHVPAAWLSLMAWTLMSLASLGVLVWRHPLADVAAEAAAPLGAAFTFLALVTGSLWGKPMWGAWWVWDARLTSELVLFLMYLGVIALRGALDEPARASRLVAVLTLVGFVNIPIVKFSVDWWNTLHQGESVFRMGGSTIDSSMLIPLFLCAVAFTLLFFTLWLVGMRTALIQRRLRGLRLRAAAEGAPGVSTAIEAT
ncbi:MAG TPA: heme ABC transporter permease [Hyphomicrobiales bacterium]|nr:heme ABC transporter permease [Hyphomicrobiales bacterium]